MITQDHYIAVLEKRASKDNQEQAISEHKENNSEYRDYLKKVFSQASSVEKEQSKDAKKLFPVNSSSKESGNPLMKAASRSLFFDAFPNAVLHKNAHPMFMEIAFRAFNSELEKIAQKL